MNNQLALPVEYAPILAKIDEALPLARLDAQNFNKSSSQFKTAILDVIDLTPINSAKHLLAIIQNTRRALEEASIKLRRKKLELKTKELDLLALGNLHLDSLEIDIDELKIEINNLEEAGQGAVRKLGNALSQYQGILDSLDKEHLTELDYENDQARYHIMTAFNQALISARSRGGLIDEGNHIYLFQLGINGAMAQQEVTALFEAEQTALNNNLAPTHSGIIEWLNRLADKYANAPQEYAKTRKLETLNKQMILEITK